MIHFVDGREPVGLTYCGGNIFVDVPQRDRVTLARQKVTCLACRLLLTDAAQPPAPIAPQKGADNE